jgi:multidrug efflux pump subunit AcrA (membrane-fusion protein)
VTTLFLSFARGAIAPLSLILSAIPLLLPAFGGGPPAPVTTAMVEEGSIRQRVPLTATVEPLHRTVLALESEGVVDELFVDVGDYVTTGTVLLRLRQLPLELSLLRAQAYAARQRARWDELRAGIRAEDVAIRKATLDEKELNLTIAERDLKRFELLLATGSASQSDFDQRKERYTVALAERDAARAAFERDAAGYRPEEIAAAEADYRVAEAEAKLAADRLERSTLRAPFAGTITARHIGPGAWVAAGAAVLDLDYIDEVKLVMNVPEIYFDNVRLGQVLNTTLEAIPQEIFRAKVFQRVYRADGRTRALPVALRLDNPGLSLAPGMLARVQFDSITNDGEKSLLVPKDALVPAGPNPIVYRVGRDDKGAPIAERVEVTTGRFFGQAVEVFGNLRPRDQVVVRGNERLRPGQALVLNQFITNPDAADVIDPSNFFRE